MESPRCRAWPMVSARAQEPLLLGTRGERVRASELAFNSKPRAGQRGSLLLPLAQVRTRAWSLLWGVGNSLTPDSGSGAHSTPEQDSQAPPPRFHRWVTSHSHRLRNSSF